MLGQRRRRWANISPTMVQRLVFAGKALNLSVAFSKERQHFLVGHYIFIYNIFWRHYSLSHKNSVSKYLFRKYLSPPPPWKLNDGPRKRSPAK